VLALLTIGAALGLNAAATGATFAHRLAGALTDAPALASIADRPADAWSLVGLTALLALAAGWLLRRRRSTEVASSGRAPHQ
jgi:LPXTG-motif cell wall-anchored protein